MKVRMNISVDESTAERLKQYAKDKHSTVSQIVTDFIWKQKVSESPMKGQMSTNMKGEIKG